SSPLTTLDGGAAKGYVAVPQVERAVVVHLCPRGTATWRDQPHLPSRACKLSSALAGRAYHATGQAATALLAMATLQVYQAKALKHLHEGGPDQGAMQELRAATDFALRATKVMSTVVVQERHLWLTLAQMADVDKARFLNAAISQGGLFGDTFSAVQKQTEAIKHILPRRDSTTTSARPQPPPAHHRGRPPAAPKTLALSPAEAHNARLAARRHRAGRGRAAPPAPQGPARNTRRRAAKEVEEIVLWGMTTPTRCDVGRRNALHPRIRTGTREEGCPTAVMSVNIPLIPLATKLGAWLQLPSPSQWLIRTVRLGYAIQYRGVLSTSVHSDTHAAVLHAEVAVQLAKDAIEPVPPAEMKSGFYSPYFIVPKKSGGLRPILDLRALNRSLLRLPFKMLTTKRMLTCIRHQDWFAAINLKDAYFHISILPRHRPFLRFAFEGRAYQNKVLPFGLSLSPRVLTKVPEAALSPLWRMGIRILNENLDDWLLIAHSRDVLCEHRDLVLRHLSHLGLQVNREKSKLSPVQRISFLGVELDSVNMTARLTNERAQSVLNCLNSFRHKTAVPLKTFQRLLGHMAAAAVVTPLGLLHMRPLQHWLHDRVPRWAWHRGTLRIGVSLQCRRLFNPPKSLWDKSPGILWFTRMPLPWVGVLLLDRTLTAMAYQLPRVVGCASCAASLPTDAAPQTRACSHRQHCDRSLYQPPRWSWLPSHVTTHPPSAPVESDVAEIATCRLHSRRTQPPPILEMATPPPGSPADLEPFRDALARSGPPEPNYAFPPVSLLAQTLCKIREDEEPHFPRGSPSLEDPLEERLSFSGDGHNLAPASRPMEPARLAPGRDASDLSGLSQAVIETITQQAYALRWGLFERTHRDRRLSPSTIKVYVAAIAAYHDAVDGASLGKHQLVVRFLSGARRVNPPRPHLVPSWDLAVTLQGLREAPFEPLASAELKYLSLKTALLTALASIKRVGDLQAFSVDEACLEFGPGDSHVILRPRPGYVPKVPTTPFRDQVVNLQALPLEEADPASALLCPVRARRIYTWTALATSDAPSNSLFALEVSRKECCLQTEVGPLGGRWHLPVISKPGRAMPLRCSCPLHKECCLILCVGSWRLTSRYL
ncbi:hypothetical protein M9458_007711, partial [Cirrhinus mrigala]